MNKARKWWISGLLSLLQPGTGQIYNGQARKGIVLLLVANLLLPVMSLLVIMFYLKHLSLALPLVSVLLTMTFYIAAVSDAIGVSNKLKDGYQLQKYNHALVYIGILVAGATLPTLLPGLGLDKEYVKANYVQAYKLPSASMEPTLLVGDHILVDRRVSARSPRRGSIIIFEYPEDPSKDFVKRVEAVEGDTVEVRNKQLYVNNRPVAESHVVHLEAVTFPKDENPRDNFGPVTVPRGGYFVMGDNRDRAYDSRFWGFVDKSEIKGTVRQIYWSWDREKSSVRWGRIGRKIL